MSVSPSIRTLPLWPTMMCFRLHVGIHRVRCGEVDEDGDVVGNTAYTASDHVHSR